MKYLIEKHAKSFAKTFVTVFIGVWLFGTEQGMDVWSAPFLIDTAQVSLVAVVRNIFKFLTENDIEKMGEK